METGRIMNKFRKTIAAISILLFSFFFSQAQQHVQDLIKRLMPQPVPASPNVAALGKFGDYPVSYFTGVPDISIPIFEVKSGGLSVPITLSYHASGIKPTDVASWVGLGWAFDEEPEIRLAAGLGLIAEIGNWKDYFRVWSV